MLRPRAFQQRLDGRAWRMLVIHGAYTAANLLAATFLSIFLWRARHDLMEIAIFTGITALVIPLAFLSNGLVFRRVGAGGSIRIGLLALGVVYLAVLLLGSDSSTWILPLGLLRGLGEGWYWAGYHLVSYDATNEQDRDWYFGALSATNWLLTAALPPLAGATIVAGARWGDQYRGYEMVFGVAAGLLLGAVALAGHLNCGRRTSFSLQQVWLLSQRNAAWHWIARARLVEGLSGALSGLVITVLTYLVLQNEEKVGDFNGLIGLLGLGISLVLAFCMRPRHRTACAMAGACLLVMSTLLLPLYVSASALVVFGVLRAIGGPLHGNALAAMALQVIDRDPQARVLRYEYIVSQELWLGIGRVISVGCFVLLAAPLDQVVLARVALAVAGSAPMLMWAFFARIPPTARTEPERIAAAA